MSTRTAGPASPSTRTYADHSAPLWRRWLVTRETAVIVLTAAVILYSLANVPNFDGPLTLKFLLQDIAPILLIALPMTLVIITGEIDLSVASIMGLSSVLLGVLHEHGMSVPAAQADTGWNVSTREMPRIEVGVGEPRRRDFRLRIIMISFRVIAGGGN